MAPGYGAQPGNRGACAGWLVRGAQVPLYASLPAPTSLQG